MENAVTSRHKQLFVILQHKDVVAVLLLYLTPDSISARLDAQNVGASV